MDQNQIPDGPRYLLVRNYKMYKLFCEALDLVPVPEIDFCRYNEEMGHNGITFKRIDNILGT